MTPDIEESAAPVTEDDYPSQSFRDYVIQRLASALVENQENAPNLPAPEDAWWVEERLFQVCMSKDEYMRTIAKVINAINCKHKSNALPSFLYHNFQGTGKAADQTPLNDNSASGE
ncbi:med15 subunit of mediator complex non-fungal domain-containing protein [Ditylenchus destructor]|uniref:Mediator of RNA polymerase II transcription subunit 15 n=1 Tax=Ditylenchus destructor TaxID=166010 RepID=A0AAD4QW04_9BILA|nr:med15 subunit of mediator complex non-fungal domain-containing protein [Ditylenchus destructor]